MTRFTWIQVLDLAVIFYIHLPGNQITAAIKRIYHAGYQGQSSNLADELKLKISFLDKFKM